MLIHSYALLSSSSTPSNLIFQNSKTHNKFTLFSNKAPIPNPTLSHNTTTPKEPEPLELLTKPEKPDNPYLEEIENPENSDEYNQNLAPFLKFFKHGDSESDEEPEVDPNALKIQGPVSVGPLDKVDGVKIQYYDPKPGDFVVGVVVSGNENKLDVNVGADMLGTMLSKEVMPFYGAELDYLLCDVKDSGVERGRMGIVRDEEALSREKVEGRPIVEAGTVIFSEVMGRTLSGRPLLSSRRMYRRVAWHRVRQIKQLKEPVEVKIFEWNTGGLLTRIEGLRAFLPKAELMNKVNSFMALKENVGRRLVVSIVRIDEATNDLIISERHAWDMLNLKEGTLLEGTVRKIFQYGALVRIGDTNRSGLLHISNISRKRVPCVDDVLAVDERVKVLVVKSSFPDKISLSIADLESVPGLFLTDKKRVFSEAEEMAKKYRQRLPVISFPIKSDTSQNVLPFDDEARLYANWSWFEIEQHKEVNSTNSDAELNEEVDATNDDDERHKEVDSDNEA